jgi:hypothetical protein
MPGKLAFDTVDDLDGLQKEELSALVQELSEFVAEIVAVVVGESGYTACPIIALSKCKNGTAELQIDQKYAVLSS